MSKIAVLGAAGGIGQPLSLLLKLSERVNKHASSLSLYDIRGSPGVAADLSHIDTFLPVTGHQGEDQLGACLAGAQIVLIPAGVPRKPGMTRDDLFNTNASIVASLVKAVSVHCPKACVLVIANPVNSTVPIACQVLTNAGVYDPRKLFGVTTLDVVRAQTFANSLRVPKASAAQPFPVVPVVGGHAGKTILPIFSRATQGSGALSIPQQELAALTHRVQFGGDEVVQAKDGAGSATLSMAFAALKFTNSLLGALHGSQEDRVQCAFVESKLTPARFFASPVKLGREGVEEILPFDISSGTQAEKDGLDIALKELLPQIQKGFDFVNAQKA